MRQVSSRVKPTSQTQEIEASFSLDTYQLIDFKIKCDES